MAGNQATRVAPDVATGLRLLVVEDEKRVATALRDGLEGEGYEVVTEATGEDAFFRGSTEVFDLILLDLGLPGRDGIEVVSALRRKGVHTPVLILTARDGVTNRVRGLSAGADDYLAKPFAFSELLARINAILRRGRVLATGPLSVGPLRLDPATRQVSCVGNEITLTAKEFELVEYLARASGQVVSRDALARDVWKETARSTTLDNVIDVHISRVRRKLGSPVLLHTIRGVGFTLREDTA
jgi:DNA-binding response OmpR family regulator